MNHRRLVTGMAIAMALSAGRGARPGGDEPAGGPADPEKLRVERALLEADGVVARAADRLGLSRQALYRKMEKLGIVLERRPR